MNKKGKTSKLTILLNEQPKNLKSILSILKNEDLLLPFNGNHLIELYTEEKKRYIPLFSDINQIESDFKYTRLDEVKLDVVIRDIFNLEYYYAITINPYTHDFIMNTDFINFYKRKTTSSNKNEAK